MDHERQIQMFDHAAVAAKRARAIARSGVINSRTHQTTTTYHLTENGWDTFVHELRQRGEEPHTYVLEVRKVGAGADSGATIEATIPRFGFIRGSLVALRLSKLTPEEQLRDNLFKAAQRAFWAFKHRMYDLHRASEQINKPDADEVFTRWRVG